MKEPFGDTAADLRNEVPKPGWVGKGRSQSKEKPSGGSMSVCVDLPSVIAAL